MRHFIIVFGIGALLISSMATKAESSENSVPVPSSPVISIPSTCRQLLVSIATDWTSSKAALAGFSRMNEQSPWQLDFTFPAVLGRKGLGWGLGIHGWVLSDGPIKKEGDLRSPAGLFHLPFVFGSVPAPEAGIKSIPYLQMTENIVAVDDPLSRFYNRMVDRTKEDPNQWKSAEIMLRTDGVYRLGVFVSHNDPAIPVNPSLKPPSIPQPGAQALGSCIFLHIWRGEFNPTVGCTAMAPENMKKVAHWLRLKDNPLLLQLPLGEYRRFQQNGNLPGLPESKTQP